MGSARVMWLWITRPPARLFRARHPVARRGFSLIELLVVMLIIGLLTTILIAVGSRVLAQQKITLTQTLMANLEQVVDVYANENPLEVRYGTNWAYGQYPPYMLDGDSEADTDPNLDFSTGLAAGGGLAFQYDGTSGGEFDRIVASDLGWEQGNSRRWADFPPGGTHNDNRALYTYTRMFAPSGLDAYPEEDNSLGPLGADAEFVNPTGSGLDEGDEGTFDVLGFRDAWGVPFDYLLYVQLEYAAHPTTGQLSWRITDRRPVFRSRGIDRDTYEANFDADRELPGALNTGDLPGKWIWSQPLPQPTFIAESRRSQRSYNFEFPSGSDRVLVRDRGWIRMMGVNEDYHWFPEFDADIDF